MSGYALLFILTFVFIVASIAGLLVLAISEQVVNGKEEVKGQEEETRQEPVDEEVGEQAVDEERMERDWSDRATREKGVEHYRRGLELGDKAEWRKAITEFDRVIDLNPNHGAAYTQRGFAYAELGKTDKAIADFENALSRTRDPKAIAYIEAEIKQLREGK